jgi:hypothetical protein
MPNGFTHRLQQLVFFSWFYEAQSIGSHSWFSNNGTFLTDAGPPYSKTDLGYTGPAPAAGLFSW